MYGRLGRQYAKLMKQEMKEKYHANKNNSKADSGEKKAKKNAIGKDGILESDSEDERMVRDNKNKRKATAETIEDKGEGPAKEIKKPAAKKQITKA